MIEIVCTTADETRSLGRRLASLVRPGDVLLLKGRLGAGKTVFAGGVAEGLGVEEQVTSPSFVLVKRYAGFMPVVHADVYRIGSLAEIDDLDLLDEAGDGVLLVEWGNVAEQQFGDEHLLVEFTVTEDESRAIRLVPAGAWAERPLVEVAP